MLIAMGSKCCCSDRKRADSDVERKGFEPDDVLEISASEKADEPAPEPIPDLLELVTQTQVALSAATAQAADFEESVEEPVLGSYLVDNSQLQAQTLGLAYRQSKRMDDVHPELLAEWDSMVEGKNIGDGWVEVPDNELSLFLPMELNGVTVLTLQLEGGLALGLPGLSDIFGASDDSDHVEEEEEEKEEQEMEGEQKEEQKEEDEEEGPSLIQQSQGSDFGLSHLFGGDVAEERDSAQQDDMFGLGSFFGEEDVEETNGQETDANPPLDESDIFGIGNLFGSGSGTEEPIGAQQGSWDLYRAMLGSQEDRNDAETNADAGDTLGMGNLVGGQSGAEDTPGAEQRSWAIYNAFFGAQEEEGVHEDAKVDTPVAIAAVAAGNAAIGPSAAANTMLESEGSVLQLSEQSAGETTNTSVASDHMAASSHDIQRMYGTKHEMQSKDTLRAALQDAAEARDVDKLKCALRDAVDGGVGGKDLGKAWNVLADEQHKTLPADDGRSTRALQALAFATELQDVEKIEAALKEGRDAGLKEAFLKPAKAVLKDLEARKRKKAEEHKAAARIALQAVTGETRASGSSLQQAIQKGEQAGLTAEELDQARALLAEMQAETRNRLAKAVMERNIDELKHALEACENAGVSSQYLEHGQQLLIKLEKVKLEKKAAADSALVEAVAKKAAADSALVEAVASKNVGVIKHVLAEAEEVGLEEHILETAKMALAEQEGQQKIEAQKALQAALSEQDIIDLRSAIEAAEKVGLDDVEELQAARALLTKETEKMVARRTLDAVDLHVVKIFQNTEALAHTDGLGPSLSNIKIMGTASKNATAESAVSRSVKDVAGDGSSGNVLSVPSPTRKKAASSSPAGSKGASLRAWGLKRSQTPTGAKPRLRSSSRVNVGRGSSGLFEDAQQEPAPDPRSQLMD